MNSNIRHLLESTHGDIADARRWLDSGEGINRVCDEIRSGLMWAMEAWLIRYKHKPNFGNGWNSMQFQFLEVAPKQLRSKVSYCLTELTFLNYQLEGGFDFKEPLQSIDEWKKGVYDCLVKTEEIIATIEQDILQK